MSETRQFRAHPHLLLDVIRRQAGTLGKAVLECVMNAVDAKATEVTITTDGLTLDIVDNGHGFRSRQEIEEFFEVFGQPQTTEKRFGTFRMGRGQAFSFGLNFWKSGNFRMSVDVANRGFDYTLTEVGEVTPGCTVTIVLYNKLDKTGLLELIDEVARMVRYLDVKVTLNEKQINRDPAGEKWTQQDDAAYYRFSDTGSLNVYNLGVLVRSYPAGTYGAGGHVVSKQQLKLNFARNDVMSDCPVWQKIVKTVRAHAGREVKRAASLTDAQREMLAKQLMAGELTDYDKLALFTDVTGKNWSLDRLGSGRHRFKQQITAAPKGDLRGDKLMQLHIAFVMAKQTLDRFGVDTIDELVDKVLNADVPEKYQWQAVDYAELAAAINDHYELIPEKEWTPLEKAAIATCATASWALLRTMGDDRTSRRLVLGRAETANGWTDGKSYIAINRDFLQRHGVELPGLMRLAQLILHEYCHDEPDTATHTHGPEFYELYHDSRDAVPEFVKTAMGRLEANLVAQNKRLSREATRRMDKLGKISNAAGALDVKQKQAAAST